MERAMVEESRKESRFQRLVERAQEGEREAFGELVRECEPLLLSSVQRQLGPGVARSEIDEVVQETFVLAFEAIGRFEWKGEAAFLAWLSRIARNVSIDRAKDTRRRRYLELPDRLEAAGASPSRAMRRGERFERLQKAIAELPPDYREAIRLSQLERLKVGEIALRMNRSEAAVKHLMARAVRRLKESFGETDSLGLPDRPLEVEGGDRG
jgi:RNA polymerase sigma-70 factor (ECF subfamily)